jgi:hypothetical protein
MSVEDDGQSVHIEIRFEKRILAFTQGKDKDGKVGIFVT